MNIYNINKFSINKFKFKTINEINTIKTINPNKINNKYNFTLITFNLNNIILNNKLHDINYFYNNLYNKKNLYVVLSTFDCYYFKFDNVICIDKVFPFLKFNYYDLSLFEEYDLLYKLYNNTSSLIKFKNKYKSIQHQYKTYLSFKQNKKIHYKSTLDNNFFFSIKSGFSDVFKLLENRPNRSIFQLDVNSMYPFAMLMDNFSIPSKLMYYKENLIESVLNNTITNGIFNCKLTIKKNLTNKYKNFIKYLPINLIDNNIAIPLHIKYGDEINILLHANEIKFYSKYFDIILEDGIYSEKSINHPLKNWIIDTYQKRLDSSGDLKDFYKFILTVSHSVIMEKKSIQNIEESFEDFLSKEYQFDTNQIQYNSYFKIKEDLGVYSINSYDIKNEYNVYSLYSQVLANARIHLLELYEKIYSESSSFELCYCNIDSLHISIPNEERELFDIILNQISSKTELGKLKIEAIANRGIWFEPGRYWLFNDNQLTSYKNTIFNDNNDDFKCMFKVVFKNKEKSYFSLFNSLQNKKKIIQINDNHWIYNKNHSIYNILENKNNNIEKYKYIFYRFIN